MPPKKTYKRSILNDTDKKVLRVAAYTIGTVTVGGILFFVGRHIYRNTISNREQTQSLTDNTDSNLAKRLKMAFDNDGWWGTDVEAVRKVFTEIPSKDVFSEVIKSYKKLYQRNLVEDLTDELTSTEYYEMQNILAAKPDKKGTIKSFDGTMAVSLAKRINAAVNYKVMGMPSTDEDAIRQALTEVPSQQAWKIIKVAYQKLYSVSLESDLDNDLGLFDYSWRDIIQKKPLK